MSARRRYLWAALVICAPVSAAPLRSPAGDRIPAQTLSAAAVRIAAPFGLITSTLRTVEHNRAVGGVPDSYHLLGQAIDIVRRPGISHAQIASALRAAGFRLIESLDEGDHSHFAFGSVQPKPAFVAKPSEAQRAAVVLAADQHGTLRLDLGASTPAFQSRGQAVGSQRRAVH